MSETEHKENKERKETEKVVERGNESIEIKGNYGTFLGSKSENGKSFI